MNVIRHDDEIGCRERRIAAVGFTPDRNYRLPRRKKRDRGIGIDARKHLHPALGGNGDKEEFAPESLEIHFHGGYWRGA